ncbi:MAG: glycoside hydrolase family 92 protein [Bacteroidales bacterium]|nr:glycoside hydrolase family 92 protein [Bacteroidales bacterium]
MKAKLRLIPLFLLFSTISANSQHDQKNIISMELPDYIQFVNPFIGTKNMGHTFPGATVPFGMVQLSPETNFEPMHTEGKYNPETYRYCSGYQYSDSTIFGFSHTHFSGTGHSDLGDFLVMPTVGKLKLEPGDAALPKSGYHSGFSHANESAGPAYYSVLLDDYNIRAELTATERVGFHRYTFPKTDSAHIILDLMAGIYQHADKNVWSFVRIENDSTVTGYRQTNGWARTRTVYFVMQFSKKFKSYGHQKYNKPLYNGFYRKFNESGNFPEMAGKEIRVFFNFDTEEDEQILVRFALSGVSTEGAMKNMQTEIPHWDFDLIRNESQRKWNTELAKIEVETIKPEEKTIFYTALYHTMLSPVIFEDVDGNYRGLDQNIHQSEGFSNYTIFSLWDTFRALHPLFNLIQPARNSDMIQSMLAHYDQSVHKMLPVWSHYANENWCMIGYHSVSVIADAMAKGNTGFDTKRALLASVNTSRCSYFDGIGEYMKRGYVPEDMSANSVSKTLEYAYDDWCIAEMAKKESDSVIAGEYEKRAVSFENVFDPGFRFMKPKLSNGDWVMTFDPLDTHGQGFIEGNAWTYSLFVPQNIDRLIGMNGGNNKFIAHLDSIFTMKLDDKYIEKNEDITRDGMIGNYVQGNEPGHHIPYLYNWTTKPWKTQERVRMIMATMYGSKEDGLCGNDDAGQMSAWYVFSALGFYPVCPGSNQYVIGSPMVKEALLHFENGKSLKISTVNQGQENVYVRKILLNGKQLHRNYLLHEELTGGGELVYYMGKNH